MPDIITHPERNQNLSDKVEPSVSELPHGNDDIMRTDTRASRFSARTTGRESDIMYADLLRSMK